MAGNGDNYYTAKEAASILGVSLPTMYRYAANKNKTRRPPQKRFSAGNIKFPKIRFRRWAGLED